MFQFNNIIFNENELTWALNIIKAGKKLMLCKDTNSKRYHRLDGEYRAMLKIAGISPRRVENIIAGAICLKMRRVNRITGLSGIWAKQILHLDIFND